MSAPSDREKLLVCNCQRTMSIDGEKLAKALGLSEPIAVHSELCRAGLDAFERVAGAGGWVHVACTQEAPLFQEVASGLAEGTAQNQDAAPADLRFTNIRENAGWSEAGADAQAKIAALLAAAELDTQPAPALTLRSQGICLVYAKGQLALDTAAALSDRLSVSVLLTDADDALPPAVVAQPIHIGRIRAAKGHLGAFEIVVDGYAPILPSARDEMAFAMARDGASAKCDLILDLSGNAPLFTAHARRDGYVCAEPGNPAAVVRAMFDISDMVGEFEKPTYIAYDASICAHARSGKVGCTNCLDHCPVGAIEPDGEKVRIDPAICGGCGNCAAVCPTGAASYAYPRRADVIARMGRLLSTYEAAGGTDPVLLLHDEKHGAEMIGAMARFGRGLPANVLPLAMNSVLQVGHDLAAVALASGAGQVIILAPPEHPEELAALQQQVSLAQAITSGLGFEGERVLLLDDRDPDAIEARLHTLPRRFAGKVQTFPPAGSKRDFARLALTRLHEAAPSPVDELALPEGAPYGRISVNVEGCTLCLSCVGACPANALADSPERPELSFTESACVQCGICVATCPENVITLEPRYNFATSAMTPAVIKGEEPFNCIECGTPFGARSAIEKVVERLTGHSMFSNSDQLKLIQMCDDCRVITLANSGNDPFSAGPRPPVRTTDDYLAGDPRDDASEASTRPRKPDDFLS